MIIEESINYLKHTPPFQFLSDSLIRNIAENLSLEFYPKNTLILTQDDPPGDSLRIIKKGGVKVYLANDEEIVIDYKSEGDCFGYLSLMSSDRERTNVMASEDTLCYLVPRDIVLEINNREPLFGEYFMKDFFKNYLDKTYREMKNRNVLFKEGEKILYTTSVGDIVLKAAVTAPSGTSIREAAAMMTGHRISSLVLTDEQGRPAGIITDRDLRDKVVAKGKDFAGPVSDIMSTGLVTIESDRSCFDALSTMIRRNIHHLIVTGGGILKGVVTNHDFMLLQGNSPLSILKNIDRQKSAEDLIAVRERIHKTITTLFKEGVRAGYVLKIITELHDRLIQKMISLSMENIVGPDCPFAFFVYGSEGRQEETFKTVFRCALVYREKTDDCGQEGMKEFCRGLIGRLQETFEKCGLPLFDISPLGEGIEIYGNISEWERIISDALGSGEHGRIETAKKMLDMRALFGDESVVSSLKDRLYGHIAGSGSLIAALTDSGPSVKPPVGFSKDYVVDEHGSRQEQLDIKADGILLIVDSLRALAVANNIHETSTLQRLDILSAKGVLDTEMRNDIQLAFEFLLHLLLHFQLMKTERGEVVDNVISPEALSVLEKKVFREVFQLIPLLRETAAKYFSHQEAMNG